MQRLDREKWLGADEVLNYMDPGVDYRPYELAKRIYGRDDAGTTEYIRSHLRRCAGRGLVTVRERLSYCDGKMHRYNTYRSVGDYR